MSSLILIMSGYWCLLFFIFLKGKIKPQRERKKESLYAPVEIWGPVACAHVSECLSAWPSCHHEAYGEYT